MRKLTYLVASTIDGFIAGPDNDDPSGDNGGFFLGEGDHIDSIFTEWTDILPTPARQAMGIDPPNKIFDTVLEGRASYDIGLRAGFTDAYPHLRHLVFSRTITESPDANVEIVAGDPVARVRELKREPGLGIWLVGGGTLADALRPEIDELIVKLHPVVAGTGIPLFGGGFSPQRFDLTSTRTFDSGVLHLTYTKRATADQDEAGQS